MEWDAPRLHPSRFLSSCSLAWHVGVGLPFQCTLERGGAKGPLTLLRMKTSEDGRDAQFEALLLEELEVEAMAVLELPVAATDLRMCGRR